MTGLRGNTDDAAFGVIWIRSSDPRSVWIMVQRRREPVNPSPEWIHRSFSAMYHDPERSLIIDPDPDQPKETHPYQFTAEILNTRKR